METYNFNSQFSVNSSYYYQGLDLQNWYRYLFLIKEVLGSGFQNILEIGAGNKIVKNCLINLVHDYKVIDINANMHPDIVSDVRQFQCDLKENFDCVICADVLEHIPYEDLHKSLVNIYNYLNNNGKALITIPHRRLNFILLTSFSPHKPLFFSLPSSFCLTPYAFHSRFIKKESQKDPYHCWEIGDGKIKRRDVEHSIKEAGFEIVKLQQLFYVDFWTLKKKIH